MLKCEKNVRLACDALPLYRAKIATLYCYTILFHLHNGKNLKIEIISTEN